jgi:four helix bundle protein
MRNYRELKVWAKAHSLMLDLYRLSLSFPREEVYGVTSQLRRAALSIGSNLAEGCGRRTSGELARFVRIAMGSASELDYQLLVCHDLGYLKAADFQKASKNLVEIRKMLTSFLNKVEEQINADKKAAVSGSS